MSAVEPEPLIAIFADESCLGNGREGDNPGGAGALVEYLVPGTNEMARRDLWVSEPGTTNNRMALRSVIESFRALARKGTSFRIVFTSDSKYLIDGMTSWRHSWAKRGWTRKGGAVENLALWHDASDLVDEHQVEWRWVRGHDGHPQNEYANHLATRAAATQSSSEGLVPSQYDAWVTSQKARRVRFADPAPFPSADEFRPASRLPRGAPARP